jgi:hypothetical protein
MAKKATGKSGSTGKSKGAGKSKAVAVRGNGGGKQRSTSDSASEAFVNLLQSPLVAELVAVAATAALTALAQEGIGGDSSRKKRAGNAVKRAGKAAAKAVGARLSTEIEEIKKAATAKRGAKA